MPLPLVSILIPAYNAERWIGAAIESALAQTWRRKEVIVVDDGSSDRTIKVAQRFAERGVTLLSQPNRGAAAARNAALRAAVGSYVQYLDADDLLHPEKIAAQLGTVDERHDSDVLLTGAWARFFSKAERSVSLPDSLWQDLYPVAWFVNKFTHNRFMFPASWLVSKALIERAGPWNERLSLDDDGEYLCRLVAASRQIRFVADAKSYYRIGNPASLSWTRSDRALQSLHASLQLCIDHLLALEDSQATRRACIRLLEDNVTHFHPESPHLVAELQELAHMLGGDVDLPSPRWRFKALQTVVGYRTAKRLQLTTNHARLRVGRAREFLPSIRPPRGTTRRYPC